MNMAKHDHSIKLGFDLDKHIAKYPGFPKDGITFYDIAPILEHTRVLADCTKAIIDVAGKYDPHVIAGVDARGFLFVTPVALALDAGVVMIRKIGKLPGEVLQESYALEYGTAELALQAERDLKGKRVVLVDDLLATGGTLEAASNLIARQGGEVVANIVIIELTGLKGREKLKGDVYSMQEYEF